MCDLCAALTKIGVDAKDVKNAHVGILTLGDLMDKYDGYSDLIYEAYTTNKEKQQ